MTTTTLTRFDIVEILYREIGLSKTESGELLESLLGHIVDRLIAGETVKLAGFGIFSLVEKNARPGRNPRTGEFVPIDARRVLVFKASNKLKERVANSPRLIPLLEDR